MLSLIEQHFTEMMVWTPVYQLAFIASCCLTITSATERLDFELKPAGIEQHVEHHGVRALIDQVVRLRLDWIDDLKSESICSNQ